MTAINANRAIRGPVTAVPVVAGTGVRFVKDVENNRVVAEVDETVLWEDTPVYAHGAGAWNPSIALSETVANFTTIKCYLGRMVGGDKCDEVIEVPVINGEAHHRIPAWPENSVNGNWFLGGIDFVGASGSQWGSYHAASQAQTKYLPNGWFPGGFWKVIGINRIASN